MHNRFIAIGTLAIVLALNLAIALQTSAAYYFPGLLAFVMAVLATLLLAVSWKRQADNEITQHQHLHHIPWRRLWPVLTLFASCLLTIEALGFYTTLFAVFFIMITVYAPQPRSTSKLITQGLFISLVFLGLLYLIFAVLLKVQTPNGFLF